MIFQWLTICPNHFFPFLNLYSVILTFIHRTKKLYYFLSLSLSLSLVCLFYPTRLIVSIFILFINKKYFEFFENNSDKFIFWAFWISLSLLLSSQSESELNYQFKTLIFFSRLQFISKLFDNRKKMVHNIMYRFCNSELLWLLLYIYWFGLPDFTNPINKQ